MSDTEVREWIRKRASIKGRLTNFNNYLIEFRQISKIEVLFNEYDTIQCKIDLLQDEGSSGWKLQASEERNVTENLFYLLISSAQDLIQIHESNSLSESQSTDNWDVLIIFMFSQKLDPVTSTKWEEHRNSITDNPTVTDFFNF
ncbi:hypothetical protein SFRURICE_010446 [Spodoptera frugiperda]|nr:hypothetical protein SFRURICE_010446 [Spodoptera frugiperda]